ncbi:MAG: DUF3883 domain-containing protein [Flavobacteriaceae bacterium]
MIDFIKSKLEKRKKVYLTDSNIILEDFRKEKEKIEEYNGRQLLEMLQNADDEAITEKEKTCYIKLTENQLTIANNGRKFSEGGIESLMYSNISPKVLEQNKVGQKGLGFRSILSWANKITIKSYDFAVEFSEDNATEFLENLIKENPEIKSQLYEKEKIVEFPIATLRCPKIIEDLPQDLNSFDTYVVVDLKELQTKEVQEQINDEINKEVLLFLNNLEKIIVESPERNFEIEKEISENQATIREFDYDTNEIVEKVWNLKSRKGKHKDKNYELKIAWNDNLDDKIGRLYSYFKTNVKFPFPALIHGTFELTSDRNHFTPKSEHNTFLTDELIQLLIDTALEISCNEISYKPLKLLSIQGKENFDTFFDDNNFSEKLKSKIRDNKVFPTIAHKYVSIENQPVFYKNNYAEILPQEKFPNIMLYSENNDIVELVEWLGINNSYKQEYLFESITEISNQLNIEKRAKLISYLTFDFQYSQIAKKELPNIFIDQENEIINSDSEIFLPPSGEKIEIPVKLNLKIINSELFIYLKKIFNSENAEVIEDRLKLFGIKVYRFGEIFRRIVSDFNNINNKAISKRESIKNLLSNLYELYKLNKDKEGIDINIPSNVSIPILNKNNGETKVTNVYLGKEYENKLCEILYGFNKGKLVGSPKILGLNEKENIIEFLKWLGVAKYPRKKIIKAETTYGEYAIKSFPFREKRIYWNDATLNSYKKLKQKGYWIKEAFVETVEDLNSILTNNSNENILYWLSCDGRITEPTETNSNSKMTIDISTKRYYTDISNNDLPSYLLWKIKEINWIETETDKFSKPTDCCISKTISKDFSPFIEIPKIKYDCQLFKDTKIKNDAIDYFLLKVGVNKEISDFSTYKIYSMLANLHNIDKDGKKAKLIYRELAENLDEKKIDKSSSAYQSFIDEGLVYCRKNGKHSYEATKNVYYVEDKTFGEDIINQFHTIEIDRRKGAKKINTLFGVMPLENLEFNLKSSPTIHQLNEIFQKEIEELKPYFYAFRLAKDTDGKELNWIKNSKITLCTKIEPEYRHNNELRDFELKPYEFIYIEKKNIVYLLIEDGKKFISLADFQSNYKFADSIAEIFSSIVKVDTHRSSFRELFKESRINRSYILETELDDKNLEKLKTAKKKLNVVDDPKIQFWFSILSTLKKDYDYRKYKVDEFADLIHSQINININDYKLIYEAINDISNFPSLIKLFTELKIDLSDFNENSTVALNIIPYYEDGVHQLRNDLQNRFDILLYQHLIDKSIFEKERFLDLQSQFETFNLFSFENSVKVDIQLLFIRTIKDEFQVDLSLEQETVNLTEIFKRNKSELIAQIKPINKTILNQIIENESNLTSLIYFAEYVDIINEYKVLLEKTEDKKEINFNNKTLKTTKDDFEELYHLITNQDPITIIEKINTTKPELEIDDGEKSKSKGSSKRQYTSSDKETLGFIGEIIVLESLKKRYGTENVVWDSGYAKKANINPKGDDNKHYDLKYKNKYGKWNFVEVKTTVSDKLEFKISSMEVNFGIENKLNYEIMIVTNALDEKKSRRIKKLPNPFKFGKDESFTNNSKFLVKNDNFTIKLNED